ncbi:hypothetical protein K443DRAFT_395449 [Laccaria amethystina LaAM-08-1]|uniref:Uncharacterized protein n=1 Tax=Laccaria amethystina LaAM-08-1 TaxID=1095629 RepID=A0A0C9WXH6_9AGAR|nr:hypothetical protein K443DRAFT_395449 [Laccaria amethystina LaAM-08-1]
MSHYQKLDQFGPVMSGCTAIDPTLAHTCGLSMALPSGHSSNCRWRRAQPGLNYTLIGTSLLLALSDKVKSLFFVCFLYNSGGIKYL